MLWAATGHCERPGGAFSLAHMPETLETLQHDFFMRARGELTSKVSVVSGIRISVQSYPRNFSITLGPLQWPTRRVLVPRGPFLSAFPGPVP